MSQGLFGHGVKRVLEVSKRKMSETGEKRERQE